MAEEIAYKINVDNSGGAKSLKELKGDFKEAQKELSGLTSGTKEYVKALEKLGKIKDDIGDLNSEINAFNPEGKVQAFGNVIGGLASGFQAATGAAALFGGESKDVEKALLKVQAVMAFTEGIKGLSGLKDGFNVLKMVLKAHPILLIATVVIGIGTALFALKDKIKIVGDAFDAIGKVITYVKDKITALTDAIGLTSVEMTKTADSIINSSTRIKNATSARYDSEIAQAKRNGKETELLEIAKLSAITKTNDAVINQLRLRQKAQGELSDDDKKKLKELQDENHKAYQDILNLSDAYKDREITNNAKATEDWKKQHDERVAYKRKLDEETHKYELDQRAIMNAFELERKTEKDEQDALDKQAKLDAMDADTEKYFEESEKRKAKIAEEKQFEKDQINGALQVAQVSTQGLMELSDLYFTIKRSNLQRGSAEDLKAAKQQFKINKALSIASATIMGVQAVIAAYQSGASVPVAGVVLGPAMAILGGITAAANIANIASAKFEGGGATVSGSSPGGSMPNVSAPTIASPTNGSTSLDSNGNVIAKRKEQIPSIKAHVVETEMTSTQKRVSGIETNAKI